MTFVQKLILSIFPKSWAADIEADSRSWVLTCPNCGNVQSVWDLGGVRYKAIAKGKWTGIRCLNCRQWHMMPMTWKG